MFSNKARKAEKIGFPAVTLDSAWGLPGAGHLILIRRTRLKAFSLNILAVAFVGAS